MMMKFLMQVNCRFAPSEKHLLRVMHSLFTNVDPDWMAYFGDALQSYKLDVRIPPHAQPADVAAIRASVLVIASDQDASFPSGVSDMLLSVIDQHQLAWCELHDLDGCVAASADMHVDLSIYNQEQLPAGVPVPAEGRVDPAELRNRRTDCRHRRS